MTEQALLIPCQGEQMVGILNPGPGDLGLLVVVGGPQYRAGSHRLFVDLCRQLAQDGITTLRFDVRGMGDSSGEPRSFEHLSQDIHAAIDALQRAAPHVRRVVLWGLCDGASACLLYQHETHDTRIAGLCLLNPWIRSSRTMARTHLRHYYMQRLFEPDFWRKMVRGLVGWTALRGLFGNLWLASHPGPSNGEVGIGVATSASSTDAKLPFPARMALGLKSFEGPVQLVLSAVDLTAREFEDHTNSDSVWIAALKRKDMHRVVIPNADHTFSSSAHVETLLQHNRKWLNSLRNLT